VAMFEVDLGARSVPMQSTAQIAARFAWPIR
jgi:hypothetical protein